MKGRLKVALLHLLLTAGDIKYNRKLIERAVKIAAGKKADWIITPELAVSGLQFSQVIGTQWITQQPDEWMEDFFSLVKSLNSTVLLGCPERSGDKLYNSVFVINDKGELIGRQRKLVITDRWSTSGELIEPIDLGDVKIGVLICADAYPEDIAKTFSAKGAQILIAPASWGPGYHGPEGEWEQRSSETGLPLFVCNRTGEDETVTFWEAESLVIKNGKRLLVHNSRESAVLTFEWDLVNMSLISSEFEVEYIPEE